MPVARELFSTIGNFLGLKLRSDRRAEEAQRKREKHDIAKSREERAKLQEARTVEAHEAQQDALTIDRFNRGIPRRGAGPEELKRTEAQFESSLELKRVEKEIAALQRREDHERGLLDQERARLFSQRLSDQEKLKRFREVSDLLSSGEVEPSEVNKYVETGLDRPVALGEQLTIAKRKKGGIATLRAFKPTKKESAEDAQAGLSVAVSKQKLSRLGRSEQFIRAQDEFEELSTRGVSTPFGGQQSLEPDDILSRMFASFPHKVVNEVLRAAGQRTWVTVPKTGGRDRIPTPETRGEVKARMDKGELTRQQAHDVIVEQGL
ncbi:MAG: hypothetical protein J3T61_00460 [Candidatus Brocadiales bacterium]|nr:hypothetical protein [Candidatus Bathyanammoxibius sp.]